ncbi:MAG TPA: hypothetical protein VGX96_06970 [Candidatus Elarobacter sp.]|nr:hypothetical protein [Candidatus Elarobacter sp.]
MFDTKILEFDQRSSRSRGLQLGTTSIGTTFSEIQPTPDPVGGELNRDGRNNALFRIASSLAQSCFMFAT